MTINWKNLAVYAVVGIIVVWAASELFQWNTVRRMANELPAPQDQAE